MSTVDDIMRQFTETGVEAAFQVADRRYQVFAYKSPGKSGSTVRWKLYEVTKAGKIATQGLTFGMADGVREALEDVVRSAEEHALFGEVPRPASRTFGFRPSPHD